MAAWCTWLEPLRTRPVERDPLARRRETSLPPEPPRGALPDCTHDRAPRHVLQPQLHPSFSSVRPGTWRNSFALLVIERAPRLKACAAISMSSGPMTDEKSARGCCGFVAANSNDAAASDTVWIVQRWWAGRRNERGFMMNHMAGWMGGGMWIWTVIGVLVVVLLVVAINKVSRK